MATDLSFMATDVLPFVLVTVAVLVVPGPSVVFAVTHALEAGPRAGLVAVLGLESGLGLHVAAACLGLSRAVAASETLFTVLQVAGAAYLTYLGVGMLRRHRPDPGPGDPAATVLPGLRRVYLSGLLVDLLNPKTALFLLAILPQFVDPAPGVSGHRILVLGACVVVMAFVVDGGYALLAGAAGRLGIGGVGARAVELVSGGTFLGLAAWTLLA